MSAPFLLASAAHPLVGQIGLCLLAAAVLAIVCDRLRLPSVAAVILAGIAIGPVGLGLISVKEDIETIAGLGLTLLLFLIGLETNLRSLLASGKVVVLGGLLQVPLSVMVAYAIFELLGYGESGAASGRYGVLYLALACGFSSTLLVVKTLGARLQLDTLEGRVCVGLLVFQDVWAIVLLGLQPNIEQPSIDPVLHTAMGVVIVVAVAVLFTRYVLPPAFRGVARSPELVVSIALGWCFGLGLLAVHLGDVFALVGLELDISVSMEMGALIAGASIATFPYAHEVVSKVGNLRDFFVTLFFVALGMSVPAPESNSEIVAAAVLTGVLVATRFLVFMPLLYVTGLDRRHAITASTKLAQVSEFALVIGYLGVNLGHIEARLVSVLIFAFVATAVATPLLFAVADPLHSRIGPLVALFGMRQKGTTLVEEVPNRPPRLVLLGFHRLASALLHDLGRAYPNLLGQLLVIDFNVSLHERIRSAGARVVYGDVANSETLHHASLDLAEVVICTVSDDILRGTTNLEIVREVRRMAPKAVIIACASNRVSAVALSSAGADLVYAWHTETSRGLVPAICAALNGELDDWKRSTRGAGDEVAARQEIME